MSKENAVFCTARIQAETCLLERSSWSLERTSFCLRRQLPETCPLERTLGKLERISLWLRPLERTSGEARAKDVLDESARANISSLE